ncbi:MAG: hypothetical protein JF586_03865 [Burkholderiales bacterium]|jgi:hypothetical protein|nr:hypothetical protein [Burkholderiales bacterium]
MPSMPSRSTLRLATFVVSLAASVLGATAAQAAGPRLLAREVSWTYDMQDGSIVRMEVQGARVLVESPAAEYWTIVNANLLVSPDGLRRIRLMRDFSGTVDHIEMQITKAR